MTSLSLSADSPQPAPESIVDKLLKYGGVVGLIAVILVVWLTQSFAATQSEISDAQHQTLSTLQQHAKEQEVQRKLLHAICVNVSHSVDARELCEVTR
jgi:hypothetical protein